MITDMIRVMRMKLLRGTTVVDDKETLNIAEPALPKRATAEAACFDIQAYLPDGPIALHPLETVKIPTGLFVALPRDSALLICSRSGLAAQGVQVINAPGVIDSDYRGEVCVLLCYVASLGKPPLVITDGMRIAQFLYIPPMAQPTFTEVASRDDLDVRPIDRTGGFGSTGL